MAEHKHKDKVKEERTILDFYNEHSQFILLLAYKDEKQQIKFTFEYPKCYELKCEHRYNIEELRVIAKRLKVSATLDRELNKLNASKEKMERGILLTKKNVPSTSSSISNEEETAFSGMNVIQIAGFCYLSLLMNQYKDNNEVFELIKKNAKTNLKHEVKSFFVERLNNSKEVKDCIEKNRDFFNLLNKIIGMYISPQQILTEIRSITEEKEKKWIQYLSNELRAMIVLKSTNNEIIQVSFPQESKYNIFPNIENNIELIYTTPLKVYPSANKTYCNHFNSKFKEEDSMFACKFCNNCKKFISKKDLILVNTSMCMICAENFALKENMVELWCNHKICKNCHRGYKGITNDGYAYCKICESLRKFNIKL